MKIVTIKNLVSLIFVFSLVAVTSTAQDIPQPFDRSGFYAAMSSQSLPKIDAQLAILRNIYLSGRKAFEGGLLMKKAGLTSRPKIKLSLFKTGHKLLEAALHADSTNAEYHFIRLMIQEHAPSIVNYKAQLMEDIQFIQASFRTLPLVVQQAIVEYSKKSKILKLQDT